MKKTIVKIQGKKDEFTCSVNGNLTEIMGAYFGFTQHIVQIFMKEGEIGQKALEVLHKDVEKVFNKNLFNKTKKESGKND